MCGICGTVTVSGLADTEGATLRVQAMLRGELPYPPIGRTMSFLLVEVDAGRAVFQGTPKFDHYNPLGSVHGGWALTLIDSAAGCAGHSLLPAGSGYTTVVLQAHSHHPFSLPGCWQ